MATNPARPRTSWQWPGKGTVMSEKEYLELEYLSPERKYEYLDGLAYLMSGGSVAHDRITRNIGYVLDSHLRSGPCAAFGVDVQVLLGVKRNGKRHYVYPDATVSCSEADRRPDNTIVESPRLVVEVLSPNTETRDRGVKLKAYQSCPTVQEIVLVSQFAQYVEIWLHDEQEETSWRYRHFGPDETVEFKSIGLRIEIADLYSGLVFMATDGEEEN